MAGHAEHGVLASAVPSRAEAGSFARTAEALGCHRPPCPRPSPGWKRTSPPLFHRTSRRMSLTTAGEAALERTTCILDEGEAVEAEVADRSITLRGRVRVATPMSFGVAR